VGRVRFVVASPRNIPAAVIFQQNFESASLGTLPSEFSGGAVESTGGFSAFGLGNRHLRNSATGQPTTFLSLSGLSAHTSITLSFDLIVWDSMDFGKNFGVNVDGFTLIAPVSTSNYFGPGDGFKGPGVRISDDITSLGTPDYGNNTGFRDQARRVTNLNINHTASTLTIAFFYTGDVTGGLDESFGIDNIVVSDNNSKPTNGEVPEPATIAITGIALAALALRKRR
jgi:hypothetical protein